MTRQLGSPGEHARWGSGFDSPWRGGGGPPVLRAPTVAKHLVSALLTSCQVSSPRLHARVASRAAPALTPPLPHHTRPPLSSARHLLPLEFGRHRGSAASRRSTFGVVERCAPEPFPNPVLARPLSNPMATVADGTLGLAAGPIPVTILASLAALTPYALLARAGTFSPRAGGRGAPADRAPGVPKGPAMPPHLTFPFAQVSEQLHPEARRPGRAQRPPGARCAPSSSHAPSYRRAGATGCPPEPRNRPTGSPGGPSGLAGWPRPHGWVTAGPRLRPDEA